MSFFVLKHVTKTYSIEKRSFNALNDVSLSFANKGLVSIVGKSGSGKSTLLKVLMGLEKPTNGEVYYKNQNITKISKSSFSKLHLFEISMIYPHYNISPGASLASLGIRYPLFLRHLVKRIAVVFHKNLDELLTNFFFRGFNVPRAG